MTSSKDKKAKLAGSTTRLKQGLIKVNGESQPQQNHPASASNQYRDRGYYEIGIDDVQTDPNQPRKFFNPEAMEDLANSIRQKGVIQPVIIRRDQDGKFFLVAGERRWRASKMVGLTQLPAILRTDENALEISLIENLQRENLNPIDEAEGLERMCVEYHYTQQKLALVIGKSQPTINEILILNRLPKEIKEQCRKTDMFPRRLLAEIARQGAANDPAPKLALFKQVQENDLKSDTIREMTRKKREKTIRSQGEIVAGKVVALSFLLEKINLDQLDTESKSSVLFELQKLKNLIDGLLG